MRCTFAHIVEPSVRHSSIHNETLDCVVD